MNFPTNCTRLLQLRKISPRPFPLFFMTPLNEPSTESLSQNVSNGFKRVALRKARDGKVIKALVKERAKVIQARVLIKGKQKEQGIGAVTNLIGSNPRMINIIGISVISSIKEATREGQPARVMGGHPLRAMAATTPKGALRDHVRKQ